MMNRMKSKNTKAPSKFQVGIDFQEKILKYIVKDQKGSKAIQLIDEDYFALLEHQLIGLALRKYFKSKNRLPKEKSILREYLRKLFLSRDLKDKLTEQDKERTNRIVSKIYKGNLKDGDDIWDSIVQFAKYVEVKNILEEADPKDFTQYENIEKQLRKAINKGSEFDEKKGLFLIADARLRQIERKSREPVNPTPFWQFNSLTNGGGYYKGAIITVLDKPKGLKTALLVNVAKGYLRLRKNVIVFDLENGEDSLGVRLEQSLSKFTKKEVLSGDKDKTILKILRKYKRFGVEIVVKRLPAYSTANDFRFWLDYYYREHGLVFQEMIVDYAGLMGSIHGRMEDEARISNAYLELKNLSEEKGFEHTWTQHHIVRAAYTRRATKYEANDTARCIEIHRHVDVLLGLNQNDQEEEGKVMRLEIIDQRDGLGHGACYFWIDEKTQRFVEFTKKQLQTYLEEVGRKSPDEPEEKKPTRKKNVKDA